MSGTVGLATEVETVKEGTLVSPAEGEVAEPEVTAELATEVELPVIAELPTVTRVLDDGGAALARCRRLSAARMLACSGFIFCSSSRRRRGGGPRANWGAVGREPFILDFSSTSSV